MVQDKINKILWDRRVILFPEDIECPPGIDYVILRDLTLDDRNKYDIAKQLEEKRARANSVPTEGELMENARRSGYWGDFEDEIERSADDHIAFLESEFEAKKKFRSRQNIIRTQLEDAYAKKDAVARKRAQLRINSAEYLAHEIAALKLLVDVVTKPDETPVFETEQDLLRYKDSHQQWVFYMLNEVMGEGPWDVPEIREIARSVEWRLVWTLSRENLPAIFSRSVGDLNYNQRMLIYWSRVYDSAFEHPEPPDKDIVDDDDKFDQWLANRDLEKEETKKPNSTSHHQEQGYVLDGHYVDDCTCGAKEKNKGKYLGEKVPHAHDCPYGTWRQYTAAEKRAKAEQIYGRNSKRVRELIDREQENVLRTGIVEEQDLRDKKSRKLLGMNTKVIPIKKR